MGQAQVKNHHKSHLYPRHGKLASECRRNFLRSGKRISEISGCFAIQLQRGLLQSLYEVFGHASLVSQANLVLTQVYFKTCDGTNLESRHLIDSLQVILSPVQFGVIPFSGTQNIVQNQLFC